jgi:phage terminase large subunit-like protein
MVTAAAYVWSSRQPFKLTAGSRFQSSWEDELIQKKKRKKTQKTLQ